MRRDSPAMRPDRLGRAREMAGFLGVRGCIPALVTPFGRDDHALDETALAGLAERAVRRGAAAVVVCGSTGEAPALRTEEHARAVLAVVEAVGRLVPVIAGVGAPCTEAAVQLAQAAEHCGASGLLCAAPPYVRPDQDGLLAHVRAVAVAADLPVMLYDVPSRAGVAFADDTVVRLHDAGLIQAIKDATGDLSRVPRLASACGDGLAQFSGDDATAMAHLAMGGAGCVSVTGNVVPALCAALQRAWAERDLAQAMGLRDRLAPLNAALFAETNPIPVKAALGLLGLCNPALRLPLLRAAATTRQRLEQVLAALTTLEDRYAKAGATPAGPSRVAG